MHRVHPALCTVRHIAVFVPCAIGAVAIARADSGGRAPAVTLEAVALKAQIDSAAQRVTARISTDVPTPIGRIAVTGVARIGYTCDGTLSGPVEYPRLVRLLARLRRVTLVQSVAGSATAVAGESATWSCALAPGALVGRFNVADTVLTGAVLREGREVPVAGAIARAGGHGYAVRLAAGDAGSARHMLLQLR